MTDKVFTKHDDPGHGWLEVTEADLADVGLTPASFSGYSYRNRAGNLFYLEEDCDASLFWERYKAKYGQPFKYETKYSEHTFIRRLPSIAD